jgi:opacity protein-like surface antigen
MKKILLSVTTAMAMSSLAMAGGNIAPVEEVIVEAPEAVVEVADTDSGLYLGLAYGYLNSTDTITSADGWLSQSVDLWDDSYGEIMLQAGYKFNQYVAVEGRYWFGVSTGSWLNPNGTNGVIGDAAADVSIDGWGIYVKPMYPVADGFNIYALLGYGGASADLDNTDIWDDLTDQSGFSWGLGAEYAFNDNVSLFVDYVVLYDDTESYTSYSVGNGKLATFDNELSYDTVNFGITYKF